MATPDDISWWRGRLSNRTPPTATTSVRAPRERAQSSGAGAFLALADDGRQYWVKVPGNEQGNQVLVNEVIVGELGRLLDAPVRERVLITIPAAITGWAEFPIPSSARPLLAHGSLHLPNAIDADELRHTRRGQNTERQAALVGLWDLCVGEDPQWLYDTSAADAVWSYDHGLWFTTGEGDWDEGVLAKLLDVVATLPNIPRAIDKPRLRAMAADIRGLTPEALLSVMSAVPVEWGTDDRDLEAMAWFLFRRRGPVADRLERRADDRSDRQPTGRAS